MVAPTGLTPFWLHTGRASTGTVVVLLSLLVMVLPLLHRQLLRRLHLLRRLPLFHSQLRLRALALPMLVRSRLRLQVPTPLRRLLLLRLRRPVLLGWGVPVLGRTRVV